MTTHWKSEAEPSLEIDLRQIVMVQRAQEFRTVTAGMPANRHGMMTGPRQLVAYAASGLQIAIAEWEEENFLAAWRSSP